MAGTGILHHPCRANCPRFTQRLGKKSLSKETHHRFTESDIIDIVSSSENPTATGYLRRKLLRVSGPNRFVIFKFEEKVDEDQNIFVGRSSDIRALVDSGECHAIIGGRKIGKSSLLNAVRRELQAKGRWSLTSSEHTRVPWAAHTYNVAFDDEIGHFEYCNQADENGNCTTQGTQDASAVDDDDTGCFNADDSLLVQIGGCIAADSDFDGVSYGLNWPGTGNEQRAGREVPPDPDHVHEPALQREPELQPDRVRGRSAAHRGTRLGRQLQPLHRRELRQPASGRGVLPHLLHRDLDAEPERERPLRLAVRRYRDQGNDEHVRRELDRSVRAAALQLLPGPEPGDPAPRQQLPQHPRPQPLPGLAHGSTRGASSGALPARYPEWCGTTTSRAFDQSTRQGFSGRQSMPSGRAETFTQ